MENQDLSSKKMNNKQNIEDDLFDIFQHDHSKNTMHKEMEVDQDGVKKVVERARFTNHVDENEKAVVNKKLSTTASAASENIGRKMVENRDKNSDITKKRYPNSSPENHEDPKEKF